MNTPLTIGGADRGLFLVALVIGAATFNFFASLSAVSRCLSCCAAARWVTATDPQIAPHRLNSARWHSTYDRRVRPAPGRTSHFW